MGEEPRWDRVAEDWRQVGRRFDTAGEKLAAAYRDAAARQSPRETSPPGESLRAAVDDAVTATQRFVTALAEAFDDPEADEGLRSAFDALGQALTSSFETTADQVKKSVRGPGE